MRAMFHCDGPPGRDRGAVLLFVLLVVLALAMVLTAGIEGLGLEETGARVQRNRLRAEALAESGICLAAFLLAREVSGSGVVHRGQVWSRFFHDPQLRQTFFDQNTVEGAAILRLFADDVLRVEIQDESGKIPINALAGANFEIYKNMLLALLQSSLFHLSEPEALRLIYALRDWLDADDTTFSSLGNNQIVGAEDDYYRTRQAPYRCKNGPLETLSELLLVRGMTVELYNGKNGQPGLKDLLTVWESRTININTAPAPVLRALAWRLDEVRGNAFAQAIIDYRENRFHTGSLEKPGWYRTMLPEFQDVLLPEGIMSLKSSHFTVTATARAGATTVTRFASLERIRPEVAGWHTIKVLYQGLRAPSASR
ncbi:general secretion pathway protein K [Solidesulfovibrio fructosivorans JJ]]|uniref:General secretion pathway protein K n=1 Tax=Solidesulfovibrio fructosivorans JJ] TaxID=596151 RepID=E1K109_SOLFR|nr:type II secretion system protein GspK [Solidesulfovibrio fructosivorans]EFL49705.1 general secretion pathway protein K [Solidesulfovibrio fructosivorans JJ]]